MGSLSRQRVLYRDRIHLSRSLVNARCVVLSRRNVCVTTQCLPALATLYRDTISVSRHKVKGTMSRQGKPLSRPIVSQSQPYPVATLAEDSCRARTLCRCALSCRARTYLVVRMAYAPCGDTDDSKWAVAHFGLLHLKFSFFLSFPWHPKFQHRLILCIAKTTRKPGKLDKMHNLYRTSLITTQCSLITMHNWVFYLKFIKYKRRPDLVFFFKIEVLDELHRPLYPQHPNLLSPTHVIFIIYFFVPNF